MGFTKWILTLREKIITAILNVMVISLISLVSVLLTLLFTSAKTGYTLGRQFGEIKKEFADVRSEQNATQANQQKIVDILIAAIDSQNLIIQDLAGDVKVLTEAVVDMKQDVRDNKADIKNHNRDLNELIRLIK